MAQDGEEYEPEYSGETTGQRFLKLRGNISGVIFEYATAPGAEKRHNPVSPQPTGPC
jgi:hypothetical protein